MGCVNEPLLVENEFCKKLFNHIKLNCAESFHEGHVEKSATIQNHVTSFLAIKIRTQSSHKGSFTIEQTSLNMLTLLKIVATMWFCCEGVNAVHDSTV